MHYGGGLFWGESCGSGETVVPCEGQSSHYDIDGPVHDTGRASYDNARNSRCACFNRHDRLIVNPYFDFRSP